MAFIFDWSVQLYQIKERSNERRLLCSIFTTTRLYIEDLYSLTILQREDIICILVNKSKKYYESDISLFL